MKDLYSTLIKELHRFAKEKGFNQAVLELNYSPQSWLALNIAVRAFGPKQVTCLLLPENGQTTEQEIKSCKEFALSLGCNLHFQPISNFLVDFNFVPWGQNEESKEGLKRRLRQTLLKHYSETKNALFIDQNSKSQLLLNTTESLAHLELLGDLYITQIIELASKMNLEKELIQSNLKRWPQIDSILQELQNGQDPETLIQKGANPMLVHKINRLLTESNPQSNPTILKLNAFSESMQKARHAEAESIAVD